MYAIEEPPVDYDAANELISETTDRSFDEAWKCDQIIVKIINYLKNLILIKN